MRRMHDILEENGSVKSIDGLPVGLEVKQYTGSTNTFGFFPEEGKSYLIFGIGATSEENTNFESDVLYIFNYSAEKYYNSASGKIYMNAGSAYVYYSGNQAVHCVVITL